MKHLKQKTKLFAKLALVILTSSLLASCLKKTDSNPAPNAALTLINASAKTDSLNLYFDNYLVNSKPVRYTDKVEYFQFLPGNHSLVLAKAGATKQITGGYATFNGGNYYTLFVVAASADSTKAILKNDSISNPAAGKAKIRFANLTYDAPSVNIGIEGGANPLFAKTAFGKITSFVEIAPGTYTFDIQDAGNAASNKLVQPNVVIEANKIYTVWTKGLWNGTTSANQFGLQLTGY